ncbi:acyl-CoA dehydrogenase [Simiduia agarivorans]|uniref:Acyl-CoA dehydrogenase domain-containing protein n=1 Tax=Simiduia agarivorans (strain DSM 21679 / JCM 13881 / BCRC 17597 / SA1) TaxID=1117647 RepID=K4KIB4_SIMAS|nr:acyl-CoA dehydrogenase [Simiduia agarivorans]AFU98894.1 acyl-CoA dehydrogenase domain-containing protein [Simiduia agarivorans SA1 = DSM 21679]
MQAPLLSERDLAFMLYELLDTEALCERPRYRDHNRETFDAAIETARKVAEKYFLPIRQTMDQHQPTFEEGRVQMLAEIKPAVQAIIEAGLACPTADYETGGMQLPAVVASVTGAYLSAAGSTAVGYCSLTNANCNLIEAHGTPEQIARWVAPMREGRWAGTMAMTEPGAGSSMADLTTRAWREADGSYRLAGNKIFISGGDHELTDNIVHLVLARVKGAPAGIKGVSLFIVPKFLVNEDGSLGERNDVHLAGLFHKMGGRGQTSCALSFGEQGGAVAYLVGEENQGIRYMFHMMNEARIMVGTAAATTAVTGYQYSLAYAKERPQGRLPSSKDPMSKPVNIIEHADVRRMLLAQKAYAEGAFALCLYGAQLADDERTAETEQARADAHTLLDFLTPVIKSWPSEYGPRANSLAIQVLGGHGYINEHPVEMFYRDNRLNAIHEGTYGVQAIDLLARKLPMNKVAGFRALLAQIDTTVASAASVSSLAPYAGQLQQLAARVQQTATRLLTAMGDTPIDAVLANATYFLDLMGHLVVAWLWLKQGCVAQAALDNSANDADFYRGKLQALQFFYRYELPQTAVWAELLDTIDTTTLDMQENWF